MKTIILSLISLLAICFAGICQLPYDIIITEFMSDPSPSAGLPESEFIELRNNSGHPVNLQYWYITDGNSKGIIKEDCIIPADSFLIVCAAAYVKAFEAYGKVTGVSGFPSLDNTGDQLRLISSDGRTIHAVEYQSAWIKDLVKAQGGFSWEMIDVNKPCTGQSNWNMSTSVIGGTPGNINSTAGNITDNEPPKAIYSYAADSIHIVVVFDKPVDSNGAVNTTAYTISDGIDQPLAVAALAPFFNIITLLLKTPVTSNRRYLLHHDGIPDCYGQKAASVNGIRTGLAGNNPSGIVINEILFNPPAGGFDYVELYNAGQAIINAAVLYIGNSKNTAGNSTVYKCAENPMLIFPGDYFVITEDTAWLKTSYRLKNHDAVHPVSKLPAFPDESGEIVIFNGSGAIIDALSYSEKLHFPLISNTEGVALERIDPFAKTAAAENWFSASGDAGYGTPGGLNSQFKRRENTVGKLDVSPETFSPDLDGFNDILSIHYSFPQSGFSCSILIFNSSGHLVKTLVRNQLCGTEGSYRWDGLNDKNIQQPEGIYFLAAEIFDLSGKLNKIRKAVILARK
jgi:hypothetical protein